MSQLSEQLSELSPTWLIQESQVTIAAGATGQLCLADPLRWALAIGPPANFAGVPQVSLSTNPGVKAGGGLQFFSNSQPSFLWSYRQFGSLIQQAWFGVNDGGAPITLTVIQVRAQQ